MVGSDLEQVMLNARPVSFNVEVSAKWKPLSFSRYPSCLAVCRQHVAACLAWSRPARSDTAPCPIVPLISVPFERHDRRGWRGFGLPGSRRGRERHGSRAREEFHVMDTDRERESVVSEIEAEVEEVVETIKEKIGQTVERPT